MRPDISAWGDTPPRFVELLADAIEHAGKQRAVAKRLGISETAVSLLLKNRYKGGTDKVGSRILDVYGNVVCPVLGSITAAECQKNCKAKFTPSNPQRVQLFRACKTCPNNGENA
jgi:DNA-binding transcriptional regulator YdaS (Cro superfamily)